MRHSATDESEVLLDAAELAAERTVSIVRMITAGLIFLVIEFVNRHSQFSPVGLSQIRYAELALLVLFLTGLLSYAIAEFGCWRGWISYATASADVLVIAWNLWLNLWTTELGPEYLLAFPVMGGIPLVLASNTLRLRPAVQIYTTVACLLGVVAVAFWAHEFPAPINPRPAERLLDQFGWQPNIVRIVVLLLTGAILILGAARGRRLLIRAVEETTLRLNLGRYLPAELAPVLAEGRIDELKAGRRARVSLLFVDIRDSTAMEESLSPGAVVTLIGTFREHVIRAAARHAGVIDKFIGDGAFVVFGVPESRPDDAARALACAKDLLAAIDGWNGERVLGGHEPIRVGVGVHTGEAFIGAIGNDLRLEFTVLGDAVNVACRLEQATKVHGVPLLASGETLRAAGMEPSSWRHLGAQPLRGRSEPVELFTLAE